MFTSLSVRRCPPELPRPFFPFLCFSAGVPPTLFTAESQPPVLPQRSSRLRVSPPWPELCSTLISDSFPCLSSFVAIHGSSLACLLCFFWFCCLCVGQSVFVVCVCFRKFIVSHLRVDSSLADGVYDLVPEQEEHQQAPSQFELDQDPSQASEEPKAVEGKHRSINP